MDTVPDEQPTVPDQQPTVPDEQTSISNQQPFIPDQQPTRRHILVRIGLITFGTVLVLAGLVGLLLPIVPGWLLIFAGLAILGTEFVWARRLLDAAKEKAGQVKAKVMPSKDKP